MDKENLRLECLKLIVERGEPLDLAPALAQKLMDFVMNGSAVPLNGIKALSVSV